MYNTRIFHVDYIIVWKKSLQQMLGLTFIKEIYIQIFGRKECKRTKNWNSWRAIWPTGVYK